MSFKIFMLNVTLILISCNTEDLNTKYIIIGITELELTQNFDIQLDGRSELKECELDINQDGLTDFKFVTYFHSSPGSGYSYSNIISSLHQNAGLLTHSFTDTIYKYEYEKHALDNNIYRIGKYKVFSCIKPEGTPAITIEKKGTQIKALIEGDSIFLNNEWSFGSNHLYPGKNQVYYSNIINSNDTTFYNATITVDDCKDFPLQQDRYIGIWLIGKMRKPHLGWIKLQAPQKHQLHIIKSSIH